MKRKRPLFHYVDDQMSSRGRFVLKRELAAHESWSEAILPGDAQAGTIDEPVNRRPLLVMGTVAAVALTILATRLFYLQVVMGAENVGLADGNRIRQRVTRAPRGVIYDRHKTVLARNVASFDVVAVPQLLPDEAGKRREVYQRLSGLIGMPADEIAEKAEARGVAVGQPRLIVSNLERDKALLFDQESSEIPGIALDVNPVREYKDDGRLSHVMGYTGRVSENDLKRDESYLATDYIGKLGLEKQYEKLLRGVNGREQTEVDAMGRPIKILASKPAEAGANLVLSIDFELEKKMTEAIEKQLSASGAARASGVALDPRNGEVLAAVSLPGYDNNLFAKGISSADYNRLATDPAQPLFNKMLGGSYPSGSIIKPMVAAAVLQEGVIDPNRSIDDNGSLEITHRYDPNIKYTFRSYEAGGLGPVNLLRALEKSSNVYFYTVGGGFGDIAGLGVQRLITYYNKFGLGRLTGIDIPGETAGRVPTPEWKQRVTKEPWYTGDTYNISVGQGDFLASPLQMAVATAAVANGGSVIKPHFLKEVVNEKGESIHRAQSERIGNVGVSPEHLRLVREGMRNVVSRGTACCLIEQQVPVAVAGKTGTAETDPNGKRKPHAWFSAFAPFENPEIVIVVLVENSGEGSRFAAPAVRETLAYCFSRPDGCVK